MKLSRYLAVFALPLTVSLGFASPAFADDEFCVVNNSLEYVRVVARDSGEGSEIIRVLTTENTTFCLTLAVAWPWAVGIENKDGERFVLGVRNPLVGELNVTVLNTETYFDKSFDSFPEDAGFPGENFGDLDVASVQKGDDGVYRVVITESFLAILRETMGAK